MALKNRKGNGTDGGDAAGRTTATDDRRRAVASARQERRARSPYSAMHTGPGRALTAVYGIFALSATARAGYQLIREFDVAPVAYSLSAFAAVVYIVATICLVIGNRTSHRIAIASCVVEFVGVIVVGILSFTHPEDFANPSVWSSFGIGYGFIPLILPLAGLWWLALVGRRIRTA